MGNLIAALRLLGIGIVSLVVVPPCVLFDLTTRLLGGGPQGSRPAVAAFALRGLLWFQRTWSRGLLWALGVRVRRIGTPPAGRWMLVGNHLGYLDIPVLAACVPCRFVSKAEVSGWPIMGFLSRLARVLFVDRGRRRDVVRVGDEIRRTLDAGVNVAFFPEGTSSRGRAVGPFLPALLQPAAEAELPCLPVAVHYETSGETDAPAWTICWWGEMTFGPHVWNLMKVGGIEATVRFSEQTERGTDRKALAARLHERVDELFVPVRQEPVPVGGHAGQPAESASAPPAPVTEAALTR